MAGCIFFGVIGHVAYVTGQEDITKVILAGPHLTFITYSYTIAKFGFSPQLFSVMLFTMFFLLGSWMLIGNQLA
ncbi:sodium/shloride dependent amino acid transporter [Anopheles sinensis]|uniref:Sodium/shloride dependent amino acid transporter n=1 Tax=Anopheles sinensis TaxID=74873 RepID=A0A084VZU2_ANOSI|nr:sodium/shloride dependent amino acid transporter [Anopheles sinensis]